jgi:hypothetical protein
MATIGNMTSEELKKFVIGVIAVAVLHHNIIMSSG